MEQSNIDQLLAKITQDEKISWVKEETFRQQTEAHEKILKKMSSQLAQGHLSKINKNIDILSKSTLKFHQSMNSFVTSSRRLTRLHAEHNKKTLDVLKELRQGGGSRGGKSGSTGGGNSKKSTMAYSSVANGMSLKGMKSTAITTAQNATTAGYLSLGKALGFGTRSLLKFGSGVLAAAGLATEMIKGVAGIINTQATMYNKLYNSGMKTDESLASIAANARFTGLSYEQFGNIAAKNSAVFATAGFKVENFSKSVNKVTKASKGYNLSIEEGATYLGDYMTSMRYAGFSASEINKDHTAAVQKNIAQLTRYSSIMGISRDEIQKTTQSELKNANYRAQFMRIDDPKKRQAAMDSFTGVLNTFSGMGDDGKVLSAVLSDMAGSETVEASKAYRDMSVYAPEAASQLADLTRSMRSGEMSQAEYQARIMEIMKSVGKDGDRLAAMSNVEEYKQYANALIAMTGQTEQLQESFNKINQAPDEFAKTITNSKNAFSELTGSMSGFGTSLSQTLGLYTIMNGVLSGVTSAMSWLSDLLKKIAPSEDSGMGTSLLAAGGVAAAGAGGYAMMKKFGPAGFRGGKGGGFGGMFSGAGAAAKSLAVSSTMGPEAAFAMAVSEFSMAVDKFASGGGAGGNSPLDLLDNSGKGGKGGLLNKAGNLFRGANMKNVLANGGKVLKGGVAGIVGGMALDYGADKLKENGHETAGASMSVASGALSGASTGALIGSILPGIGTGIGAAIGGVVGGGIAAWNNKDALFSDETEESGSVANSEQTKNIEKEQQDKINSKNEELLRVNKDQRDVLAQIAAQMSQMNSNIVKLPMQNPMG